jgi:hypothetical protein
MALQFRINSASLKAAARFRIGMTTIGQDYYEQNNANHTMFNNTRRGLSYATFSIVIGIPETLFAHFAYAMVVGRLSLGQTCTHFFDFWFADWNQAFLLIWHSVLPYFVLALAMYCVASTSLPQRQLLCLFSGGLIGALCAVLPFDHFVWYTHFNGDDPALVGPLIWLILPGVGIGGSVVGLCLGWVFSELVQ